MNTIIFTDGAARGNPGPGGWGAIVATDDTVIELGGGNSKTTNNRMELTAVIQALKIADPNSKITVHTDSSYVLKGATEWLADWEKAHWKTATKKPVLNEFLWKDMKKVLEGKMITWKLLPGHSGIPGNERCDVIATSFADDNDPILFNGKRKDYKVDLDSLKATKSKPKNSKGNPGVAYSYVSLVDGKIMTHKTWDECKDRVSGVSGARFKKALNADEEKILIAKYRGL